VVAVKGHSPQYLPPSALLGKLNSGKNGKSVIAMATFPAKQLPDVLPAPPMIKLFALNFEAADNTDNVEGPLIVSAV